MCKYYSYLMIEVLPIYRFTITHFTNSFFNPYIIISSRTASVTALMRELTSSLKNMDEI